MFSTNSIFHLKVKPILTSILGLKNYCKKLINPTAVSEIKKKKIKCMLLNVSLVYYEISCIVLSYDKIKLSMESLLGQ